VEVSPSRGLRASRPFVTTPYRVGDQGLEPEVPVRGPCWDGRGCQLVVHHRRRRKTGPPFGWVAVLRCHKHATSFSAYPPGHYPYGRVPLVDLALDGSGLELEPDDDPRRGTLLEATADAARGERWVRTCAPTPPGAVRSTQRRRVWGVAGLLGLVGAAARAAEIMAEAAEIPGGLLKEGAESLRAAASLEAQGGAVEGALRRLLRKPSPWVRDRLALLGYLAGCWGPPYRWVPGRRRLRAVGESFWRLGSARRAGARSREGP